MTVIELAKLVRSMRAAQKEYFRERRPDKLELAKLLEKAVDETVEKVFERTKPLFGDDA